MNPQTDVIGSTYQYPVTDSLLLWFTKESDEYFKTFLNGLPLPEVVITYEGEFAFGGKTYPTLDAVAKSIRVDLRCYIPTTIGVNTSC